MTLWVDLADTSEQIHLQRDPVDGEVDIAMLSRGRTDEGGDRATTDRESHHPLTARGICAAQRPAASVSSVASHRWLVSTNLRKAHESPWVDWSPQGATLRDVVLECGRDRSTGPSNVSREGLRADLEE